MAKRKTDTRNDISGCVIVDKPAGMTSHDVVDRVRKRLRTRRVGHAGTLDPGATGVLVLGVGVGTKLMQFVVGANKSYVGEAVFGASTTTLDDEGEVVETFEMNLDFGAVRSAASSFVGVIEQVPPMVSALKVAGRRLHELARDGIEVEREPRTVRVDRFDVEPTGDPNVYRIAVDCSSGTYIRSLVDDLGVALGGGAYLRNLRRVAVGPFDIASAQAIDEFDLLPVELLVAGLRSLTVNEAEAKRIRNGQRLGTDIVSAVVPAGEQVTLFDETGLLLAIYRHVDGVLTPVRVLPNR